MTPRTSTLDMFHIPKGLEEVCHFNKHQEKRISFGESSVWRLDCHLGYAKAMGYAKILSLRKLQPYVFWIQIWYCFYSIRHGALYCHFVLGTKLHFGCLEEMRPPSRIAKCESCQRLYVSWHTVYTNSVFLILRKFTHGWGLFIA